MLSASSLRPDYQREQNPRYRPHNGLIGDEVVGIAIHIGARVAARAGANEVLVSSTVRDLVSESGLMFKDRGLHKLKGVPNRWRLYLFDS
jgi:class 3 adenylate cyclase